MTVSADRYYSGPASNALALVESPAQLLNVIELGRYDDGLAGVRIAVLAPDAGLTRIQLRSMLALARQAGHPVSWHEPRLGGAAVARTVRALAGELTGVSRLVIGDPFSGVIQVIVSISRAQEVTVVDDGSATLEFARQWAAGEHLSRWHQRATPGQRRQIASLARDQIAGSVRRRLSPVNCRLRLFTCMPVQNALAAVSGVEVVRNTFEWVRAQSGPPALKPEADLVGTSLVESGVVHAEDYLAGVGTLIERYGVDRYFAHRKESDEKLDAVERLGVRVVRPALPLELVYRRGPVGRTVLSFPSTVVHTLPEVLADTAAEVVVCNIDAGWYDRNTSGRADTFLNEVSASAQTRHGLQAVAC